jgi:DNA primase
VSSVDEIKSRLDIVELVGETVKLRRAGKNYSGFCPFHPNSRTPAFIVFPDSGTWRCFGQCNEGGDIFKFVMKKEGWDFTQTLKELAQRAGVILEAPSAGQQAEDETHVRHRAMLEEAVTFFRHALLNNQAGEGARSFLKRRGLLPGTIETFGLGYAPDSWDELTRYFNAKGYTPQDLLAVGLVSERQRDGGEGGVYDRFRNRVMFPIRDMSGKMAGFGARILNPEDVPKFLNSPQTALFDKGRLLYGLDQARKSIRTQDQVVIVEGYLDVILLHQAGYTNTVSPMGTALTEDQVRLLKRFSRRMVMALDADAAGAKATLRGLEVARQAMDHSDDLTFDARGLVRHEARLQADLRVTTIPAGMDPDEVVLRNPEEWKQIVDAAKPVVIHVMETLAEGQDLDDPKVKRDIANQVLPLVEDVPSGVEREAYRQRLARLLRLDERALMAARVVAPRSGRRVTRKEGLERPSGVVVPTSFGKRAHELERHVLVLLLRHPDALFTLDRFLQQFELRRFDPQDMEHADHQLLTNKIIDSLKQDDLDAQQYIHNGLPEVVAELAAALLLPMPLGEPNVQVLSEDLVRTVIQLRQVRIREDLEQLRYLQQELQEKGEASLTPYHELVMNYNQTLARLNRAVHQPLQLD